jgi:hypothetical protein
MVCFLVGGGEGGDGSLMVVGGGGGGGVFGREVENPVWWDDG